MISSYDKDHAKKTLEFISSEEFNSILWFYTKLKDTKTRTDRLLELQKWRMDKYKTVEEVRKYIFSLKDTIEKQALVISELNDRNSMLANFIVRTAINDKIKATDMIELSDWYSDRFDKLMEQVGVQEEKTKEKFPANIIDATIKALKEPEYWYDYNEQF